MHSESSLVKEPTIGIPSAEIAGMADCSSLDHQKVKVISLLEKRNGDLAAGIILTQVFHFRLEGKDKSSSPAYQEIYRGHSILSR